MALLPRLAHRPHLEHSLRVRPGPRAMITDQDSEWLASTYPGVSAKADTVAGVIEFAATYNGQTHQFLCLDNGAPDTVGGQRLSGRFDIRIQERVDKSVPPFRRFMLKVLIPRRTVTSIRLTRARVCVAPRRTGFSRSSFRFPPLFRTAHSPVLVRPGLLLCGRSLAMVRIRARRCRTAGVIFGELERPARRRNVFSGLPGITMLGRGLGAR